MACWSDSMADRGYASIKAASLLACVALAGCDRGSDKEPRSTELSGPVGTEYSIHPRNRGGDRLLIAGCCTFDVGSARIIKLEGDVDGRMVEGDGYRVEISFGNGMARRPLSAATYSTLNIDGVALRRFRPTSHGKNEPDLLYAAIIPLDAEADRRRVRSPGLEVRAWCTSSERCRAATRMIEGVKF